MLCWCGSFSPYKDYSSPIRWQANIFVHIPLELQQRTCEVSFGVLTLFCCLWTYFIVCDFSRTIRTCVCFFSVYDIYFVVYVYM
jgi:hypothetical protein